MSIIVSLQDIETMRLLGNSFYLVGCKYFCLEILIKWCLSHLRNTMEVKYSEVPEEITENSIFISPHTRFTSLKQLKYMHAPYKILFLGAIFYFLSNV